MTVFEDRGATAVAFSMDGRFIGTGRGGAPEGRLWDRRTGDKLFQFKTSGSLVVSFTDDCRQYVLPSSYRDYLELRDAASGRLQRRIDTGGIRIVDVAVSPDGRLLAVTSHNPGLGVWDLKTGKQLSANGAGHEEPVRDLRFSPDGSQLVTAGMDGRIVQWDAVSGKRIRTLLSGSERWAGGVNFSADGSSVVAASLDQKNRIWEASTGRLLHTLDGHGRTGARYPVVGTSDGQLVSFGADQMIRAYDMRTGKAGPVVDVSVPTGDEHHVEARLSADGTTLVTAGHDHLSVYDTKTGQRRAQIKASRVSHGGFAISPDGKLVATCWHLFDAATGKIRHRFGVNGGRAGDVTFSNDGRWVGIATRSEGMGLKGNWLWVVDLKSRQTLEYPGPAENPTAIALSPHGRRLAVACSDNSVFFWETASFARVGLFASLRPNGMVRTFLKTETKLNRIAGKLVDPSGRPVSGVRVLLRERPQGDVINSPLDKTVDIADAWTDTEGRFEFHNVPIREPARNADAKEAVPLYDVIALPDEYKRGEGDRRLPLAAVWKHVKDGDEVELKAPQAATISGNVIDHEGKPLADAIVQVRSFLSLPQITKADLGRGEWPAHNHPAFVSLNATRRGTGIRTGKDGSFTFFNLPADYGVIIEATHPEFVGQRRHAATVDSFSREQRRAHKQQVSTSPLKFRLDPGHHIKVRIVYRDTGEIAKGAVSSVQTGSTQASEKTVRPDGLFELRHVPNGRFAVQVTPPDDGPASQKYVGGEKSVFLTPEKRQHLLTVRLLTAGEMETHRQLTEFLTRMEATPRAPAFFRVNSRRPQFHGLNDSGDVNSLRLRSRKLKPGDLSLIAKFPYLEKLDLHDTGIGDDDLAALARLPNLRELDISWNSGISSGVSHLQGLPRLAKLNLRLTRVRNEHLDFLEGLPNLRHLNLSDTKITDEGLKRLTEFKQLETLRLSDLPITDDGMKHVRDLPSLRGLTINETQVTEDGLKELATLPRFKWIATVDGTVSEFIRRLEAGEFDRAGEMRSAGLNEPTRGRLKLLKQTAHPRTPRDLERGITRYHLEFDWKFDNGQEDETLYLDLRVDRGTVGIMQAGIRE